MYDSNYWLCTITIDENVKVKGQEDAYKTIVTGGAVVRQVSSFLKAWAKTDECRGVEGTEIGDV